jgi:gamma-glutamyltranspeptidase/glutathione hydrolase
VNIEYNDFRVKLTGTRPLKVSIAKGKGAVATVSRQAAELAISVLKDGGNAFDAAFALAFALSIYHPQAGNIGGGGYLLYKEKGASPPKAINYREESPSGARRETYVFPDGAPNPEVTAFGTKSVCVPGTVKAFFTLQERHGDMKARNLLLSIAELAEAGAEVTEYEAECLNRLAPKLAFSPESRSFYVKKEPPFRKGDILKNPNLAKTFATLAREGEGAFYRGRIAQLIDRDMADNGGCLTGKDLAGYEIREVRPIAASLRGKEVWTVPPEGGGALLVEILNILGREEFYRFEPFGADYFHYLAQASKLAFIDRLYYLGDIPLAGNETYSRIFSDDHACRLFDAIDARCDREIDRLREVTHPETGTGRKAIRVAGNAGEEKSGVETTHFSVVDAEGNAVSNSYTLNLRYGSKWSVAGAGFLINGSMDAFSFSIGKANYFGVAGSEPNLFAARKRPASNMAPVLVTDKDGVVMALGTPGGPTIPTTLASVLLAVIAHGTEPADTVLRGRLHHQGWPDVLYRESRSPGEEVLTKLSHMGYRIEEKNEPIGDVHALFRSGEEYTAVSDTRREGQALGCDTPQRGGRG